MFAPEGDRLVALGALPPGAGRAAMAYSRKRISQHRG